MSGCEMGGACDHVAPSRQPGETSPAYDQRLLDYAQDAGRAGHHVEITPTLLGIEHGCSAEESRQLAEAGVTVLLDRETVERASNTNGLRQLVENGVEVHFYQPRPATHQKSLIVDGQVSSANSTALADGWLLR